MQKKIKQNFTNGTNSDDDLEYIGEGQWVNSSNVRFGSSDKGASDRIETILGNLEIENPYLPVEGINTGWGGCEDDQKNRICYFVINSIGDHSIFCHDINSGEIYKVLLNDQVTGGLGFSEDHYIHSCIIIEGKLYWTDNFNQPRRINIDAAIKMNHPEYDTTVLAYSSPLEPWIITLIRRSSYYAPTAVKKIDTDYENNFLVNNALQFALRYLYRDYEYSVVGAWSKSIPYNTPEQTENYIEVTVPASEFIDQDIIEVELIARMGNEGKSFIINTWVKSEIDSHNSGTALSFDFYNDINGIALDNVAATTPFESIPWLAEAIELAKNRLFLGRITDGMDSPTVTSLAVSVATAEDGVGVDLIAIWKQMTIKFYRGEDAPIERNYWYMSNTTLSPSLYWFDSQVYPAVPADPIDVTTATFSTGSVHAMADYLAARSADIYDTYDWDSTGTAYTSAISGGLVALDGRNAFKSNGSYIAATWFFDRYRRKCGVVYDKSNRIKMPERTYVQSVFNVGINWILSNAAAATEIPEEAAFYCVGRTKCLTTPFFIEARCALATYVSKDDLGVYTYPAASTAYAGTYYGIAIDISTIIGFGMGYIYSEGDLVNLYFDTTPVGKQEFSILEQDGKWLILQLKDMGPLGGTIKPLFEIYRPLKQSINELFYEVGDIYPVTNPGLSTRAYSVTSGILNGDVFLIKRAGTYFTENMSPNDKYWYDWQTDIGWPNKVDKIGKVVLENMIRFSDVYLQGTKVNGLSNFHALNELPLSSSNGPIRKLILAEKVQADGRVMLAICENQTESCYLGETELLDVQGNSNVVRSNSVIGTTNSLRGSFGTVNPESVFARNGLIEWYDKNNGCFVQYANNGLFPISRNKLKRPAKLLAKDMVAGQLVIGGFDANHDEFLFSIPATGDPQKGYLEDYENIVYPYDIYDGQAKTLVYKYEADHWHGSHGYTAEKFISIGNSMYSIYEGVLYKHNVDTELLYGKPFNSKIMFSCNPAPGTVKTFAGIGLEVNEKPSFVHLRTEDPYIQSSDLVSNINDDDFTVKEGVKYSPFYRNRLDPHKEGSYFRKQMTGEKLIGKYLLVMLEFDKKVELKASSVRYEINEGHFISR